MSDMSECNYCTFERMKRRAEREGKGVVRRGSAVWFLAPGEELDRDNPHVWFMLLPAHCAC